MKNIRTVCLLSATCLTLMSADSSFASLYQSFYPGGYTTGRAAESTSICRGAASSHIGRSSHHHTHLAAVQPAPHISSDTAIQSYFNGSPRGLLSARDDTANLLNPTTAQGARSAFHTPISQPLTDRVKLRQLVPINQQQTDGIDLPQVASVCFISDTGECSGNIYGGAGTESSGGTPPGGGDDWSLDNENRCEQEGYSCTPCPGGTKPVGSCPYDSSCHEYCENTCAPEYNKTCIGNDQQGKGEACNGLYKECCKLCSDYPYTAGNLPTGYVKGASCNSCSGTKYKAQCDSAYKYACTYNYTGHISGGRGTACDGKYKSCKCMSGYTWNASTGTCDISCDPAFDLDCIPSSYTHILGGEGSACNGKYQRCGCEGDYVWNSQTNSCESICGPNYRYDCIYSYSNHISGGAGTSCNGKYISCTCWYGYTWNIFTGTCEKDEPECDSSYKYECTPSYNTGISGGSGTACDGKYTTCRCMSDYTWNSYTGTCDKNSSSSGGDAGSSSGGASFASCLDRADGPNGSYYCCNGKIIGVLSLSVYVAMDDLGAMTGAEAREMSYSFCGNPGRLPSQRELQQLYQNRTYVYGLLDKNGGERLLNDYYWSGDFYGFCTTDRGETVGGCSDVDGSYGVIVNMEFGDADEWSNMNNVSFNVRPVISAE